MNRSGRRPRTGVLGVRTRGRIHGSWLLDPHEQRYVRVANPIWVESDCNEGNPHVRIQSQNFMLSADGFLMPAKKGQQPPDLKYFK